MATLGAFHLQTAIHTNLSCDYADNAQHHTPLLMQARSLIQQMAGCVCRFPWLLCSYDIGVKTILSNMPAV